MFFRDRGGNLAVSGWGIIASLVLTVSGVIESLMSRKSKGINALTGSLFTSSGLRRSMGGMVLAALSGLFLLVGWLVGAPQILLQGAQVATVASSTLALLGLVATVRAIRGGIKLLQRIDKVAGSGVQLMEQQGMLDPGLLQQVAEHFGDQSNLQGHMTSTNVTMEDLMRLLEAVKQSTEKEHKAASDAIRSVSTCNNCLSNLIDGETLNAVAEQLQQLEREQGGEQPLKPWQHQGHTVTVEQQIADSTASIIQGTLKSIASDVNEDPSLLQEAAAMQQQLAAIIDQVGAPPAALAAFLQKLTMDPQAEQRGEGVDAADVVAAEAQVANVESNQADGIGQAPVAEGQSISATSEDDLTVEVSPQATWDEDSRADGLLPLVQEDSGIADMTQSAMLATQSAMLEDSEEVTVGSS
ncbi:hypothetical protein cyc_04930 [Cyclospora cayetanensis]|uniref:Transmembrane protein n=1 Tax=Cyclospora cayetanensis TaxID=88456 RepID=A0A1D3CZ71_9EIME|nr:hypothetical protein cyc_04930 [Cyclospora cayetanensis]